MGYVDVSPVAPDIKNAPKLCINLKSLVFTSVKYSIAMHLAGPAKFYMSGII